MEKFIEKSTKFNLRYGSLTLYETNCSCRDIQFFFESYVMTIMLSGHKTIVSDNLRFEFFPGTLFIPEKDTINNVSIPNASFDNPTQCIVLSLNPSYIRSVYEEILHTEKGILYRDNGSERSPYFYSNDELLIAAFTKLYDLQTDSSAARALIEELTTREIIYRLCTTQAIQFLKIGFDNSISDDKIRKVISYIKSNIESKIQVATLAKITGLGNTSFLKLFKKTTGLTPTEYILRERIRQVKILIRKDRYSLQEIAYRCGFNSYEYFCSSFKKIEHLKPTEFRRLHAK